MADDACTERTGGRALTTRSSGQANERTSGRGGKAADDRADRGGKDADSGADGRTGPTKRGHPDGRKRRGRGPGGADRAKHIRTGGRADGRMGRLGGRGLHCADGGSGGQEDRQTGGRAGGPGFKRPHSTRPTSLLGAQFACLVRARVRRVLGSAVGSSTIPRQTPVLSARTHLPRLSASVLGVEKDILLSISKMDLSRGDGRGTPNRRQTPHAPRDEDGDGGKKKQRVVDMELDVFHNLDQLAYPGWEQQPPP